MPPGRSYLAPWQPVGAKNSVTSRNLHILMNGTTEPVPAQWAGTVRPGAGTGGSRYDWQLRQRPFASARFPATNEEIRTTVEASTDLISLSATELIARYAAREVSPVEVLDAVLSTDRRS